MNTVNVVETNGDTALISALHCFSDDAEGNRQAESLFRQLCRETTGYSEAEIEDCITDGYAEVPGGATIQLVHSTNELKDAETAQIKVLVEVNGGVAYVTAPSNVDVCVVDYDNEPDADIPEDFKDI